jgi:hypothetical protein
MPRPVPKIKSGSTAGMTASLATQEEVYPASLTKRKRRTKAEMEAICCALYETLHAFHPMTVRQVFYQLAALNAPTPPSPARRYQVLHAHRNDTMKSISSMLAERRLFDNKCIRTDPYLLTARVT